MSRKRNIGSLGNCNILNGNSSGCRIGTEVRTGPLWGPRSSRAWCLAEEKVLLFVPRGRNKVSKEMRIFLLVLTRTACLWSGFSVFKSAPLILIEENSQQAIVGWE